MSAHIDTQYYKKAGGDISRPPYLDVGPTPTILGVPQGNPKIRVFVSDLWYPTWEEWRQAADIAVDLALKGTNPIVEERGLVISSAVDLETEPRFLFDHSMRRYGNLQIMLNATIYEESEYESVLIVAEARRRVIEGRLAKPGKEAKEHEFVAYPAGQNGLRYAWDDLRDDERRGRYCCSVFDDPDPVQERREELIREMMRLDTK